MHLYCHSTPSNAALPKVSWAVQVRTCSAGPDNLRIRVRPTFLFFFTPNFSPAVPRPAGAAYVSTCKYAPVLAMNSIQYCTAQGLKACTGAYLQRRIGQGLNPGPTDFCFTPNFGPATRRPAGPAHVSHCTHAPVLPFNTIQCCTAQSLMGGTGTYVQSRTQRVSNPGAIHFSFYPKLLSGGLQTPRSCLCLPLHACTCTAIQHHPVLHCPKSHGLYRYVRAVQDPTSFESGGDRLFFSP